MKPMTDTLVRLDLTADDLALVEAGLRLLLMTEDDREAIDRLKTLIEQVRHETVRPASR
jgi:hypothetical protein